MAEVEVKVMKEETNGKNHFQFDEKRKMLLSLHYSQLLSVKTMKDCCLLWIICQSKSSPRKKDT